MYEEERWDDVPEEPAKVDFMSFPCPYCGALLDKKTSDLDSKVMVFNEKCGYCGKKFFLSVERGDGSSAKLHTVRTMLAAKSFRGGDDFLNIWE